LFAVCLGRLTRKPRCNTLFLCSILREKRAKHRCEPCASVMLHLRAHLGAWTVPIPSVLSVQVLCGSKKGHRPLFRPKYTKRRFFGDLLGGGAPAHPSQGHRGAARSSAYTYIRIPIINLENQGVHFGSRVHSVRVPGHSSTELLPHHVLPSQTEVSEQTVKFTSGGPGWEFGKHFVTDY
jgi:hypothetical protein